MAGYSQSNKDFLVFAMNEEDNIFCVWQSEEGKYSYFEVMWGNWPPSYAGEGYSRKEMIETTTWHDWTCEGIQDEEFAKEVMEHILNNPDDYPDPPSIPLIDGGKSG